MTERLANTISGIFLVVIGLLVALAAQSLPTTITDQFAGPAFMPTLVSIALAACGAGIVLQARSIPSTVYLEGWSQADLQGAIRIAIVAAAVAAYNLLLEPLGYIVVTFLFLTFLLWYLKVSWRANLIISVVATVGTYIVFVVWLRLVLPMGILEWLL